MRATVITFILLVVSYVGLLELWQPANVLGEHQEARNIIYAERLLYKDGEEPTAIFVGSSLVNGLQRFIDDDKCFIVSQGGGSALEGLVVLLKKGVVPEVLFVESNALTVTYRSNFVSRFDSSFHSLFAQRLNAFQYQYRPSNVGLSVLRQITGQGGKEAVSGPKVNARALGIRMGDLKTGYTNPPNESSYLENLSTMRRQLESFAAKGSLVYIVELPVHSEFIETTYHAERRALLEQHLKDPRWEILDWSDGEGLQFTDGIHFDRRSQKAVIQKIAEQISSVE